MTEFRHPNSNDLYTPVTPEILELIWQLKVEYRTWRRVAYFTQTRLKVLRNIRAGRRKAISMRLLDRILTGTGKQHRLEEFTWFTADDLVALGIWKPVQYVEGRKRIPWEDAQVDSDAASRPKNEHRNGNPE